MLMTDLRPATGSPLFSSRQRLAGSLPLPTPHEDTMT